MQHVLVTGATGVLGGSVCQQLLSKEVCKIHVLLRAPTRDRARERFLDLKRRLSATFLASEIESRLRLVWGDATAAYLGLTESEWTELTHTLGHIVHCAADLNMLRPIQQARSAAVGSAQEVLRLMRAPGANIALAFLSTVGIAGRTINRLFEGPSTATVFHNAYEQSKWEAEELVQEARKEGLAITVFRPSMIVGDSITGQSARPQVFDRVVGFLSGRLTGGVVPVLGNKTLDTIPVDIVSQAVHAVMTCAPGNKPEILHLSSADNAVSLERLTELSRMAHTRHARPCPHQRTIPIPVLAMAAQLGRQVPGRVGTELRALSILLDYLRSTQIFDNARSEDWLTKHGVCIPAPLSYLPAVVDHCVSRFEAEPRKGEAEPASGRAPQRQAAHFPPPFHSQNA